MAKTFKVSPQSVKRRFSIYVVIAKRGTDMKLYVGKTGDNNDGCNPVISRCGNHFSYNNMHSQIRNKIPDHENREYTYVFEHFGRYSSTIGERRAAIAKINEMERWLNCEIQAVIQGIENCHLLNPFRGTGYVSPLERQRRESFHTPYNRGKIRDIIRTVCREFGLIEA